LLAVKQLVGEFKKLKKQLLVWSGLCACPHGTRHGTTWLPLDRF